MRGPYVAGQLVYMFRKAGRGQLSTRHGRWLGPGRIIGTESSQNGPVPRLVWVSWNGALYRCSPEGLRPLPEDEAQFRELSQKLSAGCLHDDVERAEETLDKRWGQYVDLVPDLPTADDMELSQDVEQEPDYVNPAPELKVVLERSVEGFTVVSSTGKIVQPVALDLMVRCMKANCLPSSTWRAVWQTKVMNLLPNTVGFP